ncbi:MAG TPA: hypothetical protein VH333_26425 [Pseudonocardiaceae bacterium]|jgi:hypothetical protein|nr:hypothetical protein [Pseudonocardiaceae bacterium]
MGPLAARSRDPGSRARRTGSHALRAIGWCDLETLPSGWLITRPAGELPIIRATLDLTRPNSARLIVRGPNVFWPLIELLLDGTAQIKSVMSKLRTKLGGLLAPHRRDEPDRFAGCVVLDVTASGL